MSRILRRPMFRGGKVIDSRGTGITSGLMDKPKRGLVDEPGGYAGEITTGGQIVKRNKPSLFGFRYDEPFLSIPTPKNRIGAVKGFEFLSPKQQFPRDYIEEQMDIEDLRKSDEPIKRDSEGNIIYEAPKVRYNPGEERDIEKSDLEIGEGDLNLTEKDKKGLDEFYKTLDIKEKVGDYKGGVPDPTKTVKSDITTDAITGNQEQKTVIDPRELMKENVALFKEFLGEGNKEKLKDARIQDASDYLLKFFEGSQREGATVGSAAADVAAFATSRDSRTEKAKAAIDKQDQTAVALAINDYIAGKRSKEQLDALIAKSDLALSNKKAAIDYANKLTQGFGALPGFIADSKAIGYAGRVVDGLRKSGLSQFPIEKVTSTEMDEQFEFNPETDTGKIFIETDTKTTYTLVPDGAGGYTKNIIDQGAGTPIE